MTIIYVEVCLQKKYPQVFSIIFMNKQQKSHHIHEQTAKKSTLTPNHTNVVIGLHIEKNIF